MKIPTMTLSLFLGGSSLASFAFAAPLVLGPPTVMDPLGPDGAKSNIRYLAQAANEGKIDLTATNGFFDRCFQALDQQQMIPGDDGLIGCSFAALGRLSADVPGTARWHLWCAEAGEIKATFFMKVPAGEASHAWTITAGDESKALVVHGSDGQSAQQQTLTFRIKQPGKVIFAIDCTKNPPAAETRVHAIRLEGSAVSKASLLRTRWRPSAVHVHYFAPGNCPAPKMWVFETMDVAKTGSYSPMTTPFGYYGTSFKHGGQIPAGAGFNFSMWIAKHDATKAPPIEEMARLIGTDLPGAQYSTFGGEGTGVKFRDAIAYKNGAVRTIQALRIEAIGDVQTYYGYFYDEAAQQWKLYASAQMPEKRKNVGGTLADTGSFCEIPGPPAVERSGDLIREIKRRGWFYGSDEKWYVAQLEKDDADEKPQSTKRSKAAQKAAATVESDAPELGTSQRSYYLSDYATNGWMAMATGGIESYVQSSNKREKPGPKDSGSAPLPEYLRSEKTAQLFHLPVGFGPSTVSQVASGQAIVDYEIKHTGSNSKAILYFGTVDCLTYPKQKVTKGSVVEIAMHRPERTWQFATPEQKVTAGKNQFKLTSLQPGLTYYYRLFVTHDEGKSWDYQSGNFKTK